MKKIILTFSITILFAAAMHHTHAQASVTIANADEETGIYDNDATAHINNHALKDFQKTFSGVTNEAWLNAPDGGFIAKFSADGVETMVAYTARGTWHHTIRKYNETQLPRDVRAIVKSNYYDFSILNISEVLFENGHVYMVLLQDDISFKTLRIQDGNMEEIMNFRKG